MEAIPINDQTWIVCGGREFADAAMFDGAMGDLIRLKGVPTLVVDGGAAGADTMAQAWAKKLGVQSIAYHYRTALTRGCRPTWRDVYSYTQYRSSGLVVGLVVAISMP
jgi:hypothetical protein